jgi:transcription elongation GreA/GreB family factor
VGWIFWRVFGSTYSLDPEGVFEDLVETLDRLGIKPNNSASISNRWTEHRIITDSQEPSQTEIGAVSDSLIIPVKDALALGDRLVLRYIDKPDTRPLIYVLTEEQSDTRRGLLNIHSPLAKQLAEVDVGDEFTFKAGASEHRILFVAKQSAGSMATAAE